MRATFRAWAGKLAVAAVVCAIPAWLYFSPSFVSVDSKQQATVTVPRQALNDPPNPAQTTIAQIPFPVPSGEPTFTPGITPTVPEPTITPTPAILQPAILVTPSIVETVTEGLDLDITLLRTIDSDEALLAMAWAPTGDKLIYLTATGKLYWCNVDGTNGTLLHTYENPDATALESFSDDQRPMSDTMFIWHAGKDTEQGRSPSHIDVIHFAPGQPPTLVENHDIQALFHIHWWSPDRASAWPGWGYGDSTFYVGGERLLTLDRNAHIIEERNIPYMIQGAVQPGGEWLSYETNQQTTDVPFNGSTPETAYLLNLFTGQRLQPVQGGGGAWSPDGRWVLGGDSLLSADAHERIDVGLNLGSGASWSADSNYLASYQANGGCEPEGCIPYTSWVSLVDLPGRKVGRLDMSRFSPDGSSFAMQPRWSPDGSTLAVLSFNANGDRLSKLSPAIYLLSVRPSPGGK